MNVSMSFIQVAALKWSPDLDIGINDAEGRLILSELKYVVRLNRGPVYFNLCLYNDR